MAGRLPHARVWMLAPSDEPADDIVGRNLPHLFGLRCSSPVRHGKLENAWALLFLK
jgi:hypothetical protein